MNSFKILFWNCQGVARKRLELLHFVQVHKIDILLLNETHLSDKSKFALPNFFGYFTNRPSVPGHHTAGGTAIFIHRRFTHFPLTIPTTSIENTTIHIKTSHSELRLVAAYKRPQNVLLSSEIDALLDTPAHTIIAGDLNSKHQSWYSLHQNTAGLALAQYADSRTDIAIIAPETPTHYPNCPTHSPDILDIAIMKTGRLQYRLDNHPTELSSDHTPVTLDLLCQAAQSPPPKPLRFTDWHLFESLMNDASFVYSKDSSISKIDSDIKNLTERINSNLDKCTRVDPPIKVGNPLPRRILSEINFKRHLRSQWQRLRDPLIKTALNHQTTRVKELMFEHRNSQWNSLLGSLSDQDEGMQRFFKLNRSLLRKPPPIRPLKDTSGKLLFDNKLKAETFADSMESQFSTPSGPSSIENEVQATIAIHSTFLCNPTIFFTPGQVQEIIRKLPNRRAPGCDGLTNLVFKHCGRKAISHLCDIYNRCTRLEYFPPSWRHAEIVMLPKPGKDVLNPINHRPISLLNVMAKVFERLLLFRLQLHTLPLIRPDQFGFRPHHSTTSQLINVLDEVTNSLNRRHKTAAALLDVEKAFDKVWHDGLIYKLIRLGVPKQMVNLIKSFIYQRTFHVKVGEDKSSIRKIQAGVPQGSCLSPHLFSIYVNDMPRYPKCKTALFADDTLYYASSKTHTLAISLLQKQLNLVQPWFDKWKITINASKTSSILFTNKCPRDCPKVKIKDTEINWSSSIKYLGIHIDKDLTFSKHISHVINRAKYVRHTLHPLINKNSPLSLNLKIHIYKSYIRPTITYAGPAWFSNVQITNRKKLEAFQSITLRIITGLPWFCSNETIRNTTKINTLQQTFDHMREAAKQRIILSEHPHILEISTRPRTAQRFKSHPIQF